MLVRGHVYSEKFHAETAMVLDGTTITSLELTFDRPVTAAEVEALLLVECRVFAWTLRDETRAVFLARR